MIFQHSIALVNDLICRRRPEGANFFENVPENYIFLHGSQWSWCSVTAECIMCNITINYSMEQRPWVAQLLKKFPAPYETRKFITVFTITQPISLRSIWILSSHPSLFPSSCPTKTTSPLLSHACYIYWTSHCPWFYHSNNSWWGIEFMKLLIMQFSPAYCSFSPLRQKYSPQEPRSQTQSTYILPLTWETKFHAYKNCRKNYSFLHFNL
jgi:hypothetical protein